MHNYLFEYILQVDFLLHFEPWQLYLDIIVRIQTPAETVEVDSIYLLVQLANAVHLIWQQN